MHYFANLARSELPVKLNVVAPSQEEKASKASMVCMVEPQVRERVPGGNQRAFPAPIKWVEVLNKEMSYREVQDALSELLESNLHRRVKPRAA